MNHRPIIRVAGAALLAFAASGCNFNVDAVSAEGDFDRTLTVTGPVDLNVRSGAGTIEIRPGIDGVVHIIGHVRSGLSFDQGDATGHIRDIVETPPIVQQGNRIDIGNTNGDVRYQNAQISYDVTVPDSTRVESRVGSGRQIISRLAGPVDVTAGAGDITIDQVRGDIAARSGSGDIHIQGAAAGLEARTGSGDVDLAGEPRREWNVRTGSGEIDVRVMNQAPFQLNAQTGSGGIQSAQPVATTDRDSTRRLIGTVRGGGPLVQLRAGSGSIRID
jgi:DUF4097 and DUF4098 domain-containing protein YvlB